MEKNIQSDIKNEMLKGRERERERDKEKQKVISNEIRETIFGDEIIRLVYKWNYVKRREDTIKT